MKKSINYSVLKSASFFFSLFLVFTLFSGVMTGCSSKNEAKEKSSKKKKKKKKTIQVDNYIPDESEKDKNEKNDEKDDSKDKEDDSDLKNIDKKNKHKNKSSISAETIWADLIKGNKNFMAGRHSHGKFVLARKKLATGQKPNVIVIGCADSRVPPELVFDKNLGEIFVIRTAGNIADPIALGSIEYAAEHLHSKVLVVLGHESCGAVGASLSKDKMPTSNLRAIVNTIRPAFRSEKDCSVGSENSIKCVKLNVAKSAKDMVRKSPILKHLVEKDELTVIKAIYMMKSGKIERIE